MVRSGNSRQRWSSCVCEPKVVRVTSDGIKSVATVKQAVSRIVAKLNLNNRTQIALLAHDAGLAGSA